MGAKAIISGAPRCEPSKEVCAPDPLLQATPAVPAMATPALPPSTPRRGQNLSALAAPTTSDTSPVDASPARLNVAVALATQRLGAYITERSAGITSPMMWSPFDGTRRFRIGDEGSDGFGFNKVQLERVTAELTSRGFPVFVPAESRLVNVTNYLARQAAGEQVGLQHFPGGTPDLETTERSAVHYGNPAQVRSFVQPYIDVVRSNPPHAIMLSHATYTADGFPGLKDTRDPRPGFLRDIPFDQIPASLNPGIINYLRDQVGYSGVVTPDWLDMGAVDRFVESRTKINLGTEGSEESRMRARAFILGIEAGVDFPTGMYADLGRDRPIWQAFERNHPREYAAFRERLDERVRQTYDRVRPPGAIAVDTSAFSFEDKVQLLTYNTNTSTNGDSYRDLFADLRDAPGHRGEIARIMLPASTGDFDVWNRTGVMTMMLRQFVVESVTRQRFPTLPANTKGLTDAQRDQLEENWFYSLVNDPQFMRGYNAIRWDSPEMTALYDQYYANAANRVQPRPDPFGHVVGRT